MLVRALRKNRSLIGILVLAGVLRLLGLKHGFPFIFHPDEPTVVRSALGIRFNLNPGHFDWPHLYIYLNYFLYMIFAKVRDLLVLGGLKEAASAIFPLMWNDDLIFYLLTRTFSALLGMFTVIPVYLTGKALFSKKVGLLSALSLAIFPYHVWHSHYSVLDVPMVFFFAWATYFSVLILKADHLKNYLLAGFFVGLAASTKYHGALAAFVLIVAYLSKFFATRSVLKGLLANFGRLFLAGLFSLLGFLAGTPYALLDWETFSRTDGPKGAFWQFTNVGSVDLLQQFQQLGEAFIAKFMQDWSPAFVLLFLASFGYSLYLLLKKKLEKQELASLLVVFIPSLFYLFYISGFEKNRSHYYIIAYPLVVLAIGWFLARMEGFVKESSRALFLVIVFALPFGMSVINSAKFVRKDTRLLMKNWLTVNSDYYYRYNFYYGDDGFEQVLPEKASSLEESPLAPYVVFSDCESVSVEGRVFRISAALRRGPEICIYVQD